MTVRPENLAVRLLDDRDGVASVGEFGNRVGMQVADRGQRSQRRGPDVCDPRCAGIVRG